MGVRENGIYQVDEQGGSATAVSIADGSDASVKATVKDYTDSNPLTVVLVDTNGDPYVAGSITGTVTVIGNKTDNLSTPAADNIGALVAKVSDFTPIYTDGKLGYLSTDILGNLRVRGTLQNNQFVEDTKSLSVLPANASAAAPTYTDTLQVKLSTDLSGNLRTLVNNGSGAAAVNIQDGGNSITVDGSVNATVNGTVVVSGGSKGATTQAVITSTPAGSNHQPLDVILYNSAGLILGQTAAFLTTGGATNNFTTPGTTSFSTLPAIANALNPTDLEGRLVALSTDLAGNLRTIGTVTSEGLVSDSRESYINGDFQPLSLTSDGRLRVASSPSDSRMDFYDGFDLLGDADAFGMPIESPFEFISPY